jgi:arabinan endo-1,5-alpha-L-arabinosidase
MLRSSDLVTWQYIGDVFSSRPSWVAPDAGLWSPDIVFRNGLYYLYYAASDTVLPGGGSAIGVATAASPLGPWSDAGSPVVEPHAASCCAGSQRWAFGPEVVQDGGSRYIFYGSYFGGVSARRLAADGLSSDPATEVQITIPNKYEEARVIRHNGLWYLLVSATNCCNGPLTGYSVFAGRSANVLGPYVDRAGASLLAGQTGGTPVISMNGNRWVGAGAPTTFTDFAGQDWMLYAAVDRGDPYFSGEVGFTKHPLLLDPLDWSNGWPSVRGGFWASDDRQRVPAAQPGDSAGYRPRFAPADRPGLPIPAASDEFDGITLNSQWTWVRPPNPATYSVGGGSLQWATQAADLYADSNNASVLTEPAPPGDFVVDAKLSLDLPPEGCCFNYVQAGVVLYGDDDNYVKLSENAIWETRQTEFAKEIAPVAAGYPRYGNTVVGAPGYVVYLRIVHRSRTGVDLNTAYTSTDGTTWTRGGTWTHTLGSSARIGLVAMGGSGFTASFDYVRVATLG